jgi:hypothetical protein
VCCVLCVVCCVLCVVCCLLCVCVVCCVLCVVCCVLCVVCWVVGVAGLLLCGVASSGLLSASQESFWWPPHREQTADSRQ